MIPSAADVAKLIPRVCGGSEDSGSGGGAAASSDDATSVATVRVDGRVNPIKHRIYI